MGKTMIKAGFVLLIYFFVIGIVCPYLVSSGDTVLVISGFVLIVLTAATVPSVVQYLFKGVK